MKSRENSILEIQTAESGMIIISSTLNYDDNGDVMGEYFTITEIEGYGGHYWSYSHIHSVLGCLNHLENPPMSHGLNRNFISWWLNCRPSFVDNSIKSILNQRIVDYHLTGEIRNTFRNARYGLEFNNDCLLEWHNLLNIEYDKKLLDLIPPKENHWYNEIAEITILFDGFLYLPYSKISLRKDLFPTFQNFLDYLYGLISNEVNQFSYGKEWILFNTNSGEILQKDNLNGSSPLSELSIKNDDKIICYKK